MAQSHRTQRQGDPERSQKHPSDKAARPDRCSSRKLRPRAKIAAPFCSRPVPGFAVLAVFCSEFNSGPKPFVAPWPIARALPQAPDEGGRGKLMEPRSYWLTFTIIKREAITCCVYHINAKYTIMCKWSRGGHGGTRSDRSRNRLDLSGVSRMPTDLSQWVEGPPATPRNR